MKKMNKFNHVEITKYVKADLDEGKIYISKKAKEIYYTCPNSNCKHEVHLPMRFKGGVTEIWYLSKRIKKIKNISDVTISPSIWSMQHKDKCHYFVKEGKIVLAE